MDSSDQPASQPTSQAASQPASQPGPPARERVFSAPTIVIVMAGLLVALHAAYSFSGFEQQQGLLFDFALAPERFWAPETSDRAYPSLMAALLTLLSTGFLHGDWMHVMVNAAMLMAFGTPVARALGGSVGGAGRWMLVFLGAVIAGSALYLAFNSTVDAPYAVGASGGTSGLMAAALLVGPGGYVRSPLSRDFLGFTVAFAVVNVVLVLAGPSLLGMGISWEAHAGGYIAGGLLMLLLGPRARIAA